jgi:hypothetical protein
MEALVHDLGKVVLSQTNDTWLMRVQGESKTTEVLLLEAAGCTLDEVNAIMAQSLESLVLEAVDLPDWDSHNQEVEVNAIMAQSLESLVLEAVDLPDWESHNQEVEMYVQTRQARLKVLKKSSEKESRGKKHASKKTTLNKGKITDNNVNQFRETPIDTDPRKCTVERIKRGSKGSGW